jgi:hypothetical protein
VWKELWWAGGVYRPESNDKLPDAAVWHWERVFWTNPSIFAAEIQTYEDGIKRSAFSPHVACRRTIHPEMVIPYSLSRQIDMLDQIGIAPINRATVSIALSPTFFSNGSP